MPRPPASYTVGDWMKLSETITPEVAASVPYVEYANTRLQSFLEEVQKLSIERDFHEARRLEATKRIREILDEGRRLANLLRKTLKDHHGPSSEQLAAYGIQPYRGRKRRKQVPEQTPEEKPERQDAVDPQRSGDPSA
jgi:hypothetical protein